MKIKEGFVLRTVIGKPVILAEGAKHADFNKVVSLNPSAALLWQSVEGKTFSAGDLADILVGHYDIDATQALEDATEIAGKWLDLGIIEE